MKLFDLQLFATQPYNAANTVVHTTNNTLGYEDTTDAANNVPYSFSAGANGEWGASSGLTPEMKTFYDKALIELVGPKLVHDQFGQKRPIPRNGGKSIEFRKFETLDKATKPITEGVTPAGNKLSVNALTVAVEQYGDYIQLTDMLEMTAIDNIVVEATKKLSDQAGRTMDTITREVINAGFNRQFCPTVSGGVYTDVTSRAELDGTALLRVKDVFSAAARLKKRNAPTIGGSYVAIIHPYVSYDLMQEAGDQWVDITKYTEPGNIMTGEIGKLGNVRFVETSEAKIFTPEAVGTITAVDTGNKKLTVADGVAKALADDSTIYINGTAYTVNGAVAAEGTTVYVDEAVTSVSADDKICIGWGKPVFSTLVLGADAYGTTDIAGGGIEHIVKQKGYGNDPLDQRSSVGWKAIKAAVILSGEYMQRIESNATLADTLETN